MNPSDQYPPSSGTADTPPRRRGFTLFGFGLVLLCLGLATFIAGSELKKFRHRAHCDQFITDLRSLAVAFESYRSQKGEWPAATNPEARTPRGLEATLAGTPWLKGPPFGGSYDWIPPERTKPDDGDDAAKPPPGGMIAVTAFSPNPPLPLTPADLNYIDGKLDDGNLATGRFRTGFNGWPVYLVPAGR
jgi:type II secretory pathway pseudopilin PulG